MSLPTPFATVRGSGSLALARDPRLTAIAPQKGGTRQSQIVAPQERLKVVNAFERYAMTMAYNIPSLWYQRIVVNNKKVKGWDLTPKSLHRPELGRGLAR